MRIQLVTQMWPSPENPDLGSFLVPLTREIRELGHDVEVTSISRRGGGPSKYAALVASSIAAARRFRPEVVFAHFLFPAGAAGAAASLAARAPLVTMAHGQDVANIGEIRGVGLATGAVVRRSAALIANSRWLAGRLAEKIPTATGKTEIADCGIDLDAFQPADPGPARAELGWDGDGPAFLCVGDGPLRSRLEGRDGVRIVGRIPQSEVPRWVAACDVLCQPSLIEPFGQATLEGMAMERSVVATTLGGPPEFVTAESGVLVEPGDTGALAGALEHAAAMPSPNPAAREAAALHDVRIEATRMVAVLTRAATDARRR